jgi:hypothetical protein
MEARLEFKVNMVGEIPTGAEYPAAVEVVLQRAVVDRVSAPIRW